MNRTRILRLRRHYALASRRVWALVQDGCQYETAVYWSGLSGDEVARENCPESHDEAGYTPDSSLTVETFTYLLRIGAGRDYDTYRNSPYKKDEGYSSRRLHPPAPECLESAEHDWRSGSVYSSGGGVKWTDTCRSCGLLRRTNTWDYDRETGAPCETITYDDSEMP